MTKEEIEKDIDDSCKIFSVDPNLVKAIITQESNWNQFALRYEITYCYLFKPDEFAKKLKISRVTESTTQKMSWGLGQIMGGLARELGFEDEMPQLVHEGLNIFYICKRLNQLKEISPDLDDIIAMYNGGPGAMQKHEAVYKNQGYVDSVKNHLKNLTV